MLSVSYLLYFCVSVHLRRLWTVCPCLLRTRASSSELSSSEFRGIDPFVIRDQLYKGIEESTLPARHIGLIGLKNGTSQ